MGIRERLNKLKENAIQFWNKMNKRTRIMMGIAAGVIPLGLIAAIIIVVISATRPQMSLLYSGLSGEDANAVISELRKTNTKYELQTSGEGTNVLIDKVKVPETRIDLAGKGLPTNGTAGYELFDKTKLGVTDFTQKVNLRRALEGELSRTISGLDNVENAKVMIVIPEPSVFVTDQKKSTAAVTINIKKNKELSEGQVRGIMNLVSSSIEGLKPEDVTIVDSSGTLLSNLEKKKEEQMRLQMSELQLKQKIEIEERYEKKIKEYLSTVFGEENVVVAVTAELDFDKRNREDEVYEPVVGDKGIPRSQQTIAEKYLGTGTVPEVGVPGTTSNIPGYKGLAEGNAEYNREEETTNYEVTRRITKQEDNLGDINRLQVAVIINEDISYQNKEPYIRGNRRAELQDNIAKAANLDPQRGDAINLAVMKFKPEPGVKNEIAAQQRHKRLMQIIYGVFIGLALIGIILLSFFALRNAVVPEEVPEEEEFFEEEYIEEPVPVEELLVPELTDEQRMREKIKEEVLRMVNDDPEGAALIVRSWLFEE